MIRGLSVRYGQTFALHGVDLTVRPGQIVGVIGSNGAGKSSLVHAIAGLVKPAAGSIELLGKTPASIGTVLQRVALPDALTVEEVLHAFNMGMSRGSITRALDEFGLAHRRRVPVRKLSLGERRRVDIAAALLGQSNLLLLDEPTNGVDPAWRPRIWQSIRTRADGGAAILSTTQLLDEVDTYCDALVVLSGGRSEMVGSPRDMRALARPTLRLSIPHHLRLHDMPCRAQARIEGGIARWHGLTTSDVATILAWAAGVGLPLSAIELQPRRAAGAYEELLLRPDRDPQ